MKRNLLSNETSPYLLQHKDNPVHWQPWGQAAFDLAQAENKPILLSIGYAACHWCHVMAHESFENSAIAELMNSLFINIKVDREERPDVDKIYMDAIHALGEQGGWPLTIFMAPDGRPFWGGTYFPPESRYGRPGFPQVLAEISRIWHQEPEKAEANASAITEALNASAAPQANQATLTSDLVNQAAVASAKQVDTVHGGLSGAPKFPQTSTFEMLWRHYIRNGTLQSRQAVEITLKNICQGGIYDHLGGGFARYSVDQYWLAPHFEKMLYDNAQLIALLARVHLHTGEKLFRIRIEETVKWLQRDMMTPSGAFAASYDADSEGKEGKYYVWSENEIDSLLGADSTTFKSVYDISAAGNWEGTNIPNRLKSLDLLDDKTETNLARSRQKLFDHRLSRIPPGWDDKVLADWNGLTVSALAIVGLCCDEPGWIDLAKSSFDATIKHLMIDGVMFHSYRDGKTHNHSTAEDYANLTAAALALYQATADRAYIGTAEELASGMIRHHWDNDTAGFYFSSDLADNLIVRSKYAHDDATPNANGTMLAVFTDLYLLTGKDEYDAYARQLHDVFAANIQRVLIAHANFLSAFDHHASPTQAVIVGPADDPMTAELRQAVLKNHLPLFIYVDSADTLPQDHIAFGKEQVGDQPTLYLCTGNTCSLPVTKPEDVPIN